MGKTITSPVKKWPGSVTLFDPLTYPQLIQWQTAIERANEIKADITFADAALMPSVTMALLPGICACVEKWELEGLPASISPESLPATPRQSAGRLIIWLVGEIGKLADEADEIPNA